MTGEDRYHVLFAIPTLDHGGPDRVFSQLIAALPRDRFRVGLAVSQTGGRYFSELPPDVAVHPIGGGRYPVLPLARLVREVRPDVVLATLRMTLAGGLARPLFPRATGLVLRPANAFTADFEVLKRRSLVKHRVAQRLTRLALSQADLIVCQSTSMADDLAAAIGPHPREVIGNPIDVEASLRRARRDEAALDGAPRLLAVGRLSNQKGFDLLVRALPLVLRAHPGAVLTLLGEGEERDRLEGLARELGVAAAVRFAGRVDNTLAYMRVADLLISSSRYEGFSNVILEAMAVGCPVVATDCPGASRDQVREGETGWLARTDDVADLAAAVLRALAADRAAVARRAQERCASEWGRDTIALRYGEVLAGVARARRERPSRRRGPDGGEA